MLLKVANLILAAIPNGTLTILAHRHFRQLSLVCSAQQESISTTLIRNIFNVFGFMVYCISSVVTAVKERLAPC
jgi:hypothetical protein